MNKYNLKKVLRDRFLEGVGLFVYNKKCGTKKCIHGKEAVSLWTVTVALQGYVPVHLEKCEQMRKKLFRMGE